MKKQNKKEEKTRPRFEGLKESEDEEQFGEDLVDSDDLEEEYDFAEEEF